MAILANEAECNLGGAAYKNYNLKVCLKCLRGGQVEEAWNAFHAKFRTARA